VRTPAGTAKAGQAMPGDVAAFIAHPSDAQVCERAVLAIWKSLDAHDLVNGDVRERLADLLAPLTSLPLGGRPERLIKALRMPDPIGASQLYWLTRRLLTLVPELQALEHGGIPPGSDPSLPH